MAKVHSSFEPYRAPCAGDGPIDRPARDICWRVNGDGPNRSNVTPQVVNVAAWYRNWARMSRKEDSQFLWDLGLEVREGVMGQQFLCPAHLPQD
jgi:hypothetical protein